jgi:hypothetical protein
MNKVCVYIYIYIRQIKILLMFYDLRFTVNVPFVQTYV